MSLDLSQLFHESSKDKTHGGAHHIPFDPSAWPKEWLTVYYKGYERCEKVALSRPKREADLFKVLESRSSRRDYTRTPLKRDILSSLLLYANGIPSATRSPGRAYPSGGSRYSIEAYVIVFSGSEDMPPGVYHYNIRDHALDVLWKREFTRDDVSHIFTNPFIRESSFAVVLTAVFQRARMKYSERSYRYVMLEAGHIGQNYCLVAEALSLKTCPMAGTADVELEELLDIDGITESVVHSVIFD
jgi:SagB-type dehydrogenase family enzyme